MKRFWRIASLVATLLFAQIVLAAHGVEHAFGHAPDAGATAEVCIECLALCGIQGAPPPAQSLLDIPLLAAVAVSRAVPPAPTFARLLPFHSRAPPSLRS